MSEKYSYFDETYFLDGQKKGTVYSNYIEASRTSGVYRDIAETIVKVFQPSRCLEIGCATGIIVKHINDLGRESHGIDVSQWAVDHREHPNVQLSGAEALPFPDDFFDLVFSCHSLEHIPTECKDAALAEMTRVCSATGTQFHMLPILGMGPYVGERQALIDGLRADPTHNLLLDKDEWVSEWQRVGWRDTGLRMTLLVDTESYELTESQFILSRFSLPAVIQQRLVDNNVDVAHQLHRRVLALAPRSAPRSPPPLAQPGFASNSGLQLAYDSQAVWKSAEAALDAAPADLTLGPTSVVIALEGEPPTCRIAVGSGWGGDPWSDCAEHYFSLGQGLNCFALQPSDFRTLRGSPDFRAIRMVSVGGTGSGSAATLRFWCTLPTVFSAG